MLIFSCSGGSNVGQLSNQAAVDLTRSGKGKLACLAGIGAHHSVMIESAKAGDLLVAIDGCPVKCAQKTLEHANLKPDV
ncbi:MAG TPA: putative zinc-binding protein, partial [Methanotrichaceae archaeon]|nr:putative zinc-binding protein [Methanotrichaceae archaeon]